jgi:hypothetical protein
MGIVILCGFDLGLIQKMSSYFEYFPEHCSLKLSKEIFLIFTLLYYC